MSDSNVTLVGNLTKDPELRYTSAGKAVATAGIAVNKRWMNRQTNEWEEQTSFFNIVAWETLAENLAESFSKGDRVIVSGDLEQRSWETTEGEKRSTVEVKVSDIGASVRWATVAITKNQRAGGDRPPHPADTERQPAMAGAGGVPVDDEPF